jgi:hypothetical protein
LEDVTTATPPQLADVISAQTTSEKTNFFLQIWQWFNVKKYHCYLFEDTPNALLLPFKPKYIRLPIELERCSHIVHEVHFSELYSASINPHSTKLWRRDFVYAFMLTKALDSLSVTIQAATLLD